MIEILESGVALDFLLKFVNGTGGLDGLDGAAVGADEVVSVDSGNEESEVSSSLVETEPTDHSFITEALEETKDSGLVALL